MAVVDLVEAMIGAVIEAYGRLDYAFNNAGSGGKGGWTAEMTGARQSASAVASRVMSMP